MGYFQPEKKEFVIHSLGYSHFQATRVCNLCAFMSIIELFEQLQFGLQLQHKDTFTEKDQ